MLGRITNQQLLVTTQRSLQSSRSLLTQLQDRVSTGKAITKPSDDPAAMASLLRIQSQQRAATQYGTNIADGTAWLSTVDTTLSSAEDILGKVRDLTVRGASSGALTPASREAIATELEGLKGDLLSKANATYLGRNIFAGSSDAGVAFDTSDPTALYTFTGAAGATVQRRVDDTESVRVDADGAAAFGAGATSVFATIDSIVKDLHAGTDVGPRLTELDAHLGALTTQHAFVGTRYARLQQAASSNLTQTTALESQRASVEDVDPAKAILDLKSQETTYQSALAVTARALQPTLLSYLS